MYQNIWFQILDIIFNNKKELKNEIKNNSRIEYLKKDQREVKIKIEKKYLENILLHNSEKIKKILEKIIDNPISYIYLNDKKIDFDVIKKLKISDDLSLKKIDNENIALNKPLNYQSEENKIDNSIFIKQQQIEDIINKKSIVLIFFNYENNETKKILFYPSKQKYPSLFKKSLLTIPFIIPSIYYLILAINYKKNISLVKKEIEDLIALKYRANNLNAKNFIEKYIDY